MNFTELRYIEVSDVPQGEDQEREVMVNKNAADLTIDEFMEELIIPLMKGVGYSDKLIDEALGGTPKERGAVSEGDEDLAKRQVEWVREVVGEVIAGFNRNRVGVPDDDEDSRRREAIRDACQTDLGRFFQSGGVLCDGC